MQEGVGEFFSSRMTKKQRRSGMLAELMSDEKAKNYVRRVAGDVRSTKQRRGKGAHNKQRKRRMGGK